MSGSPHTGTAQTRIAQTGSPLFLRSVQRRPATAVLLLLITATAVLTLVLGPLLSRAVHESALADALASAEPSQTAVAVTAPLAAGDLTPVSVVQTVLTAGRAAAPDVWQEPRTFFATSASAGWRPGASPRGETIASRITTSADPCLGYVLTAGRCPRARAEVLLSAVDSPRHRAAVGTELIVTVPDSRPFRLRVTGLYDPDRSDQAPLLRPGTDAGALAQVGADSLVVTMDQAAAINLPYRVTGRLLLRPGTPITVDREPDLRRTVDAVTLSMAAQSVVLEFDTGLPDLLDGVDAQSASARVLIAVTAVQAFALALFTLAIVLQRVAHARAAEWGLGRLRGVPRLRWLSSVYVEPTVALLLGGVVGVWAGVVAAGLVVRHELRPGTPIDLWRWPVLAAAAVAVLGALVALVVVSLRSVRRPLVELLQQTSEGRRLTAAGAIGQTAVLLLAAVSLYQLLTGGALGAGGSQLGLLAPASFSLALAVMAVRVAVVVVGRVTARPSRNRAALVVGRRAARVPSSLNPAVLVAAGLALALFATQTWVFSVRNQDLKADATTGAEAVLKLTVPAGTDLIAAVRRADPSGRYAMAAQEKATSADGGTSRIVAVDSTRLAAVTSWSPAWSGVEDIAGSLRGSTTSSISLRGTSVTVRLADVHVSVTAGISPGSGRTADIAASDLVPPTVSLVLDTGAAWVSASLGPLGGGGDRRAEVPCARSCRVVGIELKSSEGSAYQSSFVVAGIGTDLEPMALSAPWLADASGWQERVADQSSPQPLAGSSPAVARRGLSIRSFDDQGGLPTMVSRTDAADPMPALLGPTVAEVGVSGMPGIAYGTGLNGQSQLIRVLGRASVLPRSLDDGVLVDLSNAHRLSNPADSEAVSEVWLAPGAPPDIERSLREQGISVQTTERLAVARTDLQQQAVTRGAAVAGWLGLVSLALALLALGAARIADSARRASDWSSLRAAGLGAGAVRQLVVIEIAVPALFGVALGTAAGLLAVVAAAPQLPLVDSGTPGPPLDLALARGPVGLVVAAAVAVVVVIATVAALLEGRSGGGPR